MKNSSKDQQTEWLQKAEGDERREEYKAWCQVPLALAGPVVRDKNLSAELCDQARNPYCLYLQLSQLLSNPSTHWLPVDHMGHTLG